MHYITQGISSASHLTSCLEVVVAKLTFEESQHSTMKLQTFDFVVVVTYSPTSKTTFGCSLDVPLPIPLPTLSKVNISNVLTTLLQNFINYHKRISHRPLFHKLPQQLQLLPLYPSLFLRFHLSPLLSLLLTSMP